LSEIEIPRIVKKTRALLALRGFGTHELLEYEDRYVMHPQGTKGDVTIKYVIWILKEDRVVGIAITRDLFKEMEETEAQRGILVGGNRFTPAAKKYAKSSRIELVEGNYASFDLFEHDLVPTHIIAEKSEVDLVLKHYKIKKTQLPRIYLSDPAARVLGARPGEVIRIERVSETAGRTFYYRLVVDN
jgi:DNA-directed RNA polymerase I, II, and III subunit RPABC1